MSHASSRGAVFCSVLLGASLFSASAAAFKEPGHRAIEAAAYRKLLECEEGEKDIHTLIQEGVLNPPHRAYPDPTEDLNQDYSQYTVEGLLLSSHLPDHLLDRQLQKELQCFHFNARGSHVTKIPGQRYGIAKGLVVDAYVECMGVADALLRSVLYDPVIANETSVGMYTLMHMIEDSFAESHVARDPRGKIVYLKSWSLRTWWSYLLEAPGSPNDATRMHFSDQSHALADVRDDGYLTEPDDQHVAEPKKRAFASQDCSTSKAAAGAPPQADTDASVACITEPFERRSHAERKKTCLEEVSRMLGRAATEDDLKSDLVVPTSCLSDRALAAAEAVRGILHLVARHVPNVMPSKHDATKIYSVRTDATSRQTAPKDPSILLAESLSCDWETYRERHLAHVDPRLTRTLADPRTLPSREGAMVGEDGKRAPPSIDVRKDKVYPALDLVPAEPKTAGAGLSTELTAGTPLWLGFEAFVARDAAGHSHIRPLLDFLGYGVQIRLPLEDALGERPVGVALDIGPGLPIPVSKLVGGEDKFSVYLGARARVAYTAQSVFEEKTRHVFQGGFGGASLDVIVGNWIWFGGDFPRVMWHYDTWTRDSFRTLSWNFSGGVATDVF